MLITINDPNSSALSLKTTPVLTGNEAVSIIVLLEKELANHSNIVGLSANQIGISKSVSIIRYNGVHINLINPSIVSFYKPFVHRGEGCMSIPKRRFSVPRFGVVKIKNHILWKYPVGSSLLEENPNVKPIDHNNPPRGLFLVPVESAYAYDNPEESYGGIVSVAVQHEMDHLDGITIDRKLGVTEDYTTLVGSAKVGRNDPCPCGSGKKFKKCCLAKL